jgi:preprotein translocase subunit SecA
MIRVEPDLVYRTEREKFDAIVDDIIERSTRSGQPVLVGTVSIEKSELLSSCSRSAASRTSRAEREVPRAGSEIVAQAGPQGRGHDRHQHGRPRHRHPARRQPRVHCAALGGLHIIGTERHEARRIDNQLRGRAGRQGDPGSSRFYLSLEDDLMRIFGSIASPA